MSRKTKPPRREPSQPVPQFCNFDVFDTPPVARRLALVCGSCGARDRYDVGTVTINPAIAASPDRGQIEGGIGFTGYFRCRKCNAGGPWGIPTVTLTYITMLVVESAYGQEDVPLICGQTATFDKKTFRYATECEDHLKALIDNEPDRAFLWVRLGNLYSNADKHEWAETAYERAIELDPKDIEAHSMLGQLLLETDRYLEAVPCFHAVLRHVRDATKVNLELRRDLARDAIGNLLAAHAESNGQTELLPTSSLDELQKGPDGEPAVVELVEIDLGSGEGLDELCDMYLGEWQDNWRSDFRRPMKPKPAAADDWLTPPIYRSKPAVGRNQPCPCGSGHKYKKCCGRPARGRSFV